MAKKFIPVKIRVGPQAITDRISDNYAMGILDVREQFDHLTRELFRWTAHMEHELVDILRESLEPTFQESQVLVPKDTGDLQHSGYLETRAYRGKTIVEIGYGKGGVPDYAVLQHEELSFKHDEPTQAKFLERPLAANADDIRQFIEAQIKEASGV